MAAGGGKSSYERSFHESCVVRRDIDVSTQANARGLGAVHSFAPERRDDGAFLMAHLDDNLRYWPQSAKRPFVGPVDGVDDLFWFY